MAFFDETGAIASDRFFVVGLLRVDDHTDLLKKVKLLRKKHSYWDEFKWSGITEANKNVYKELITLLVTSNAKFSCFVADRHVADPVARFGNTFAAYEKLAIQLLLGSIRPYELVTVLADNYSAPNERSFEQTVRTECNNRLGRLGVVSVVQVDSKATEGLQLVDVLTGAVGFEFKANAGLASHAGHKGEVSAHLRTVSGVSTFNVGHTDPEFLIAIYEHEKWLKRQQKSLARAAAAQRPERVKSPDVTESPVAVADAPKRRRTRRKRRGGRGRNRRGEQS